MTCVYAPEVTTEPLISTGHLARALGVSVKTVQRYRRQGLIEPAIKLTNGHARWRLADVEKQLNLQEPPTDPS